MDELRLDVVKTPHFFCVEALFDDAAIIIGRIWLSHENFGFNGIFMGSWDNGNAIYSQSNGKTSLRRHWMLVIRVTIPCPAYKVCEYCTVVCPDIVFYVFMSRWINWTNTWITYSCVCSVRISLVNELYQMYIYIYTYSHIHTEYFYMYMYIYIHMQVM